MTPTFSIITPSLNCGKYLPRNLASVALQEIPEGDLEHWVIDGGSTDSTLNILRQHSQLRWVSEKDQGLSDAVNKGIRNSGGEWVIWLNADDALAPDALQTFLRCAKKFPAIKIFAGDQNMHGYNGEFECLNQGRAYTFESLLNEDAGIAQASIFVHRSVYNAVGLLDISFRYAMDYEWMVRACKAFQCVHIPAVLTRYYRRPGSIMDAGIYQQHQEFLRTRRLHDCSYLSKNELRFRYYMAMQPLRRIYWFRSIIRNLKSGLGLKLNHRYEAK